MLRRARILPNSPALSKSNRLSIEYIACENTGLRSTATWKGLRHVTAPFFATNDDDNEMMPNHLSSLLVEMLRRPDCGLVYSGVVKAEGERRAHPRPRGRRHGEAHRRGGSPHPKGLQCSALAWSKNCPPFGDVTGVAILTLQPNS